MIRVEVIEVAAVPPASRSEPFEVHADERIIGNALLSNTTSCEASRLLVPPTDDYNRWRWSEAAALRVYDLMSLIDAVVLHERVFYLPGVLPDDTGELELRNRLVDSDVLVPLPQADDPNVIGKALLASLRTVKNLRVSLEDYNLYLERAAGLVPDEIGATGDGPFRFIDGDDLVSRFGADITPRARSFDQAAQFMILLLQGDTGRYAAEMSLRAMYYVFASEHYGLPYLAPSSVRSMERRFPNYFRPSVTEKLYEQLASALRATTAAVAEEFHSVIVSLPPFSALVLDRASTPTEIPSQVLAMREEYSDLRRKMRELERERLEARSLNDRLKALRRIERLGREVARPFKQQSQMSLETSLRYIPDAVELATNPTNPAGWAKVLLGAPTEALLSWYWRRPVAKLVRTAKAVGALRDYSNLLTKHFGEEVTTRAMGFQKELQKAES